MTTSVMAISTIEQEVLRKNDPFGEPVLVALRGSHSHGLYIPPEEEQGTDDIDIMNIVVPGLDTYFGLSEYGRRGSKDYWEGEYDVCSYTLEKFIRLLLKSNPNVISILWLKKEHYIKTTPIGQQLIDAKREFISKQMFGTFVGYANAQLHKMEHNAHMGYMGKKRKNLVTQFGYDTKNAAHCIRLLRMCKETLSTGDVKVFRDSDREELLDIKKGKYKLEAIKAEATDLLEECKVAKHRSELPDEPNADKINRMLQRLLMQHFNLYIAK